MKRFLSVKFVFLFFIFLAACFLVFGESVWDGNRRVSMAVSGDNGDVYLVVFDPHDSLITKVFVPGNTMIGVSWGMGSWPVRSVWKLGYQEKYGGEFFRTSLMKNFKVPIDLWADSRALGFASSRFDGVISAVFGRYHSNMSFKDRLLLGVFSLRVREGSRVSLDISDLGFLEKSEVGGDDVYLVRENVPVKILGLFGVGEMLSKNVLVSVVDSSESGVDESLLTGVIEHTGSKVVSFEEGDRDDNLDCVISSGDKQVLKEFSRIFMCKSDYVSDSQAGVEFRFGEKFARRW